MSQNNQVVLGKFEKMLIDELKYFQGKKDDLVPLIKDSKYAVRLARSLARIGHKARAVDFKLNQVFKIHVQATSFDEKVYRADIDWVYEGCELKDLIKKQCAKAYDVSIELKNFDKTSDAKRHSQYGYDAPNGSEIEKEIKKLGYRPASYSEYLELHAAYPSLRYVRRPIPMYGERVDTICLDPHAWGFQLFEPHKLTFQNTSFYPNDYVPVVKL